METQMWTVAEAKAKFSEVIDRALRDGPQTITRNGRTAAVIVGADEWQRKSTRVGNLAEFFAASPLRGSGLKLRDSGHNRARSNFELSSRYQCCFGVGQASAQPRAHPLDGIRR